MTSGLLDTRSEHLLRELAPQVLGAVVRRFSNFAAAEDAVQEALIAASLKWPHDGVPDSPRAWLIQVASRRMLDYLRSETARRLLTPTPISRRYCKTNIYSDRLANLSQT